MLGDFARFFALDFRFFLFVLDRDEGWSSSDESTAVFFLRLLIGASVSLALEARGRFEDLLFDCLDCFGGGFFKGRTGCLELEGMVEVSEMEFGLSGEGFNPLDMLKAHVLIP
jgi:hypothetical protein